MQTESYLVILLAVFSASLSHCIGMCGGIALGLNMQKFGNSTKDSNKDSNAKNYNIRILQIIANLLYFLGRSISYVCVGLTFSIISSSVGFNDKAHAIMLIILGILLFLFAFSMAFFPQFLNNIFNISNLDSKSIFSWYKKFFKYILLQKNFFSFFIIGILNGFLPCHLVYMFALKAASSTNLLESFFIMLIFCAGTFLPLFLVGIFSATLLNLKIRDILLKVSFIIMAYFAVNNIYNGVNTLLNNKATNNTHHLHHH